MDVVEERQAVHALHAQVGDHHQGTRHGEARQRGLAGFDRGDGVAGGREAHRDQLQQVLVVVDQQDLGIFTAHWHGPFVVPWHRIFTRLSLRGIGKRTRVKVPIVT